MPSFCKLLLALSLPHWEKGDEAGIGSTPRQCGQVFPQEPAVSGVLTHCEPHGRRSTTVGGQRDGEIRVIVGDGAQ